METSAHPGRTPGHASSRAGPGPGPWLLAALLGPVLQLQQPVLWPGWVYATGMGAGWVLVLAGEAWRGRQARTAQAGASPRARWRAGAGCGVSCLGVMVLAFALVGLRAAAFQRQALPADLQGRDLVVTGVVASLPQPGELGLRFEFEVESASQPGVPPRLQLSWYDARTLVDLSTDVVRTEAVLMAGDRWRLPVRLKSPHGTLNPWGFDQELAWWERGIQATGYIRPGRGEVAAQRLGRSPWHGLQRLRQRVRDAVFARVRDPAQAGVLAALVVGDQQAIERADWDLFRATGVAHLMSISGLHVTMFAWAASAGVGGLWRRSARLCLRWPAPHAAALGGVLLATAYAAFSGGGVPAQRTVWMLAAVSALRLAGLRWPWPQTWLAVAALVVTLDPWSLGQAGFWLSFVAVGVLFATDGAVPARPGARARLLGLLREQGIVTVALAPLTLWLFGQVSVVALAANLLAIPWVTGVVTPLALGGLAWPALWDAGAWAVGALRWGLQVLASVPYAVLDVAAAPAWMAAAALLGGLLLVLRLPPGLRAQGLPLLLPMLLWSPPRPAPGQFELLAADIGQGNAVLVRTARHALLYDTGPRWGLEADAGQRLLVPLLRAQGERLDRVVVSHQDSDHSGGAPAVLAAHPGADLLSSLRTDHPVARLRAGPRCEAGQRWRWDGVDFEVLHPRAQDYEAGPDKPNAMSCVLRIAGAGGSALLVGDIEAPQERRLVDDEGDHLHADVLLVPHHGSKTSSTEAFLQAVRPRLALVQAGWRNRFGHPAPPVLQRYARRDIAVVASPACGAARWSSEQPAQVVCERVRAQRYWHHIP